MERTKFVVKSPITPTIKRLSNILVAGEYVCEKCKCPHTFEQNCGTLPGCKTCSGLGWLHPLQTDGTPNYSRVYPCPDCQGAYQAGHSPVIDPYGISKMNDFSNFVRTDKNAKAYDAAKSLAAGKSDFIFLTIYGITGNGKSHLANAVGRELQRAGEVVKRLTMQELLDYLQNGITDNTTFGRTRELEIVPFLIIDDLKIEYLTSDSRSAWNLEKLEQIINYRYEALLPTLVTTNNQPEQLPARLQSRLSDKRLARMIWNEAPDYRRIK
jgi:DNA replication protein DnaC